MNICWLTKIRASHNVRVKYYRGVRLNDK